MSKIITTKKIHLKISDPVAQNVAIQCVAAAYLLAECLSDVLDLI